MASHHSARNQVCRFADNAGLNLTPEQSHLLPPRPADRSGSNLRRPADVFIPSWVHGHPAAFDLGSTSPQRQEIVAQAALEAGAAAVEYEGRKRQFFSREEECLQQGILFVPLVARSSDGWGPVALCTFRMIAKRAAGRGGSAISDKTVLPQFPERACIAIRSTKARAVFRRSGASLFAGSSMFEAARAALAVDP